MKRLIVIAGPTGVGKSDVAVELAQRLGGEQRPGAVEGEPLHIISADSRQLYRGMAIGTAQPTAQQLAAAPHHFVTCAPPTERYTCARWAAEAEELLTKLFETGDTVIVAGGSGLYIDALTGGIDPMPDHDPALRERLSLMSLDELLEQLRGLDPVFFEEVDRKNPRRVLRAVEVCLQSGRPYSQQRIGAAVGCRGFEVIKIALNLPREELYARIDRRVELMMAAGLLEEARALLPLRVENALQTVGYRELFDHFDGRLTLQQAVELIQRNSRRYAKRQLTWLRRDPAIAWFSPHNIEGMVDYIGSRAKAHF